MKGAILIYFKYLPQYTFLKNKNKFLYIIMAGADVELLEKCVTASDEFNVNSTILFVKRFLYII